MHASQVKSSHLYLYSAFNNTDCVKALNSIAVLRDNFITPVGRFCFNRLPFGFTSAPNIFQREMSTLQIGHKGTVGVTDDILVNGKD